MATLSTQVATASRLFLQALGAPASDPMVKAVGAWLLQESGGHITGNNPWNLHSWGGLPGQTGYRNAGPGDKNVAIFATLQAGCTASAMNLERLAPAYGYGQVIAQARAGNAVGFLDALAASSWSAGHYGGPGPNNKLRRIYASLGGSIPPVVPGHEGGPPAATGGGGSSAGGVILAIYTGTAASATSCPNGVTILSPSFSFFPLGRSFPIPQDTSFADLKNGCVRCTDGYVPGVVGGGGLGGIGPVPFGFTDPSLLPVGIPNACIRADLKVGDGAGAGAAIADTTAAAIAGLPIALGNIGAHLVILVVILALLVLGLKAVVDGGSG